VIAYEELDNPFRMWIEYPNFDRNRSYGLVHKGFTAGIVYSKFDKALAHLQLDKRVVFSVLIGSDKLLGVLFGNEKNLLIKYIPAHANVKIGDEVVTSGSDNLFYEGIKVGKVVEIKTKNIYKIAIVEPYMKVKKPNFFYIVDLTQTIQ
jgi:rod shape-determining protein MreC